MKNKILPCLILSLVLFYSCSSSETNDSKTAVRLAEDTVFVTPLGLTKAYPTPSVEMTDQYNKALENYNSDPDNAENIIWLGRRAAYLGNYKEAIQVYTEGINKFPENPKLYRHRGHRYISIREFNKAIADLEKAAALIKGTTNEIEPDGMPNARNIPVSSLHGNIYYHLGLAYYLVHDYEKAYEAYLKCRNSGNNPDNIVSSTHWLYIIQRRLNNPELADSLLNPIENGFDVIENTDYYTLCRLYKGLISLDSVNISGDSPSSDALKYGLANWYFYNADEDQARAMFENMMSGNSWTSFGYIAAESDILRYFSNISQ